MQTLMLRAVSNTLKSLRQIILWVVSIFSKELSWHVSILYWSLVIILTSAFPTDLIRSKQSVLNIFRYVKGGPLACGLPVPPQTPSTTAGTQPWTWKPLHIPAPIVPSDSYFSSTSWAQSYSHCLWKDISKKWAWTVPLHRLWQLEQGILESN